MTFANGLTSARLMLIPVFVAGLLFGKTVWPLAVFVLCVATDVADGIVARRTKTVTPLGAFLDPLADKLLLNAAFFVLAVQGRLPIWLSVFVLSRDLVILLGWYFLRTLKPRITMDPGLSGKAAMFLQSAAVLAALAPVPASVRMTIVIAAAASTLVSLAASLRRGAALIPRMA
jgi:cardiolipin synthase